MNFKGRRIFGNANVSVMSWGLRFILVAILIFSIYHFIRDLLQTFNLDNALTDIGHRAHIWCGQYCDVVTIPFDILGIVIPAIILWRNRVGFFGCGVACDAAFMASIYAIAVIFLV